MKAPTLPRAARPLPGQLGLPDGTGGKVVEDVVEVRPTREEDLERARLDMASVMGVIRNRYDLTTLEVLKIMAQEMVSWATWE